MNSTNEALTKSKPLIGIKGCVARRHYHEFQKQAWATPDSPIPIQWFEGPMLKVGDGYFDLTTKVQAMCRWALERGYTHMFVTDDDCYLRPERLLNSGFQDCDYMGAIQDPYGSTTEVHYIKNQNSDDPKTDACSFMYGGCGYWMSAKMMKLVAESDVLDLAEDRNSGKVAYKNKIDFCHDDRLTLVHPIDGLPGPAGGRYPKHLLTRFIPLASNDIIAAAEFKGEYMLDPHKYWLESNEKLQVILDKCLIKR